MVAVLVVLSVILTAATVFPDIAGQAIIDILVGCMALFAAGFAGTQWMRRFGRSGHKSAVSGHVDATEQANRYSWRMPPLDELPPPVLTFSTRLWMGSMRGYLVIAVALVVVKVVQMAMH